LFELNASHFRTKDIIEKIVGAATQNASFDGKKRLVLLDEIDGIHGKEDKGGLQAILQVIKDSQNPLILTANDIYADKKLAPLRTACTLWQFMHMSKLSKKCLSKLHRGLFWTL
jgi:replication factor C large subunit